MRAPRIGIVLGGGGVIGNAYLSGVLEGIRQVSGWDPCEAQITVGTSAGSVSGALSALGVSTEGMYHYILGEPPMETGTTLSPGVSVPENLNETFEGRSDMEWTENLYPRTGVMPRPFLSSPHAVLRGLLRPRRTPLELFVSGLIGEGFVSTRTIGQIIERVQARGWPSREYWAVAVDLESGRRVALGRRGAPVTDVSRAVRASCAIPGFFAPVRIQGRRYVDGGVWSVSNLDLVAGLGLDLVICINPMSSLEGRSYEGPVDRFTGVVRRLEERAWHRFGRRLGWERSRVERKGTPVALLQPTTADLEVIPLNLMEPAARAPVARRALKTTIATLETSKEWRAPLCILADAAKSVADSRERIPA
jgi:NTE family protein